MKPLFALTVLACFFASVSLSAQNQVMSVSALGGSGYVEMPASPSLTPANLTLETWMTYTDTGLPAGYVYPTIARRNFTQGISDYFLRVDAGNTSNRSLRAWFNGSGGVVSVSYVFAPGAFLNWTHVAVTYDGSFARLYVNGTQVAQAAGTGPLVGTTAPARIGAGDTSVGGANEYWNGFLDNVRIWSVARTPQEIASSMFQTIVAAPNLNASYLLDGDGLDASGNSNHGTVILTPAFPFVASPTPLFEQNSPSSGLDFGGVIGTGLSKALTNVCTGANVTVNSIGPVGVLWEAAYNAAPTVPAGAPGSIVTANGQIVNLDLNAGVFFLFGGGSPMLLPYPGSFSASFAAPSTPATLSFQQVNSDPGSPDGFALSQAAQLNTVAATLPAGPLPGPTGDDSQLQVNVGCVSLYGRSFTTMFIQSNGRLTFGAGNTTFTPTAALFASNPPSFGCWTDLNPALGGTITLNQPTPGFMSVAYTAINYFGTTIPNTFALELDTNTNIASITGLTGIAVATGSMLIGISGGNVVGATIPAAAIYSPGGLPSSGSTTNATDMIYNLGPRGAVTTGINRIDFFVNAFNNHDWISL